MTIDTPASAETDLVSELLALETFLRPLAYIKDGDAWMRNGDGTEFRLLAVAPELEREAMAADPGHKSLLAKHAKADIAKRAAQEISRLSAGRDAVIEACAQVADTYRKAYSQPHDTHNIASAIRRMKSSPAVPPSQTKLVVPGPDLKLMPVEIRSSPEPMSDGEMRKVWAKALDDSWGRPEMIKETMPDKILKMVDDAALAAMRSIQSRYTVGE